jgi:CxxC motif-containing protein (DUF1111 family)
MTKSLKILFLFAILVQFSCSKDNEQEYTEIPEAEDLKLGGSATIFSTGPDAYTIPPDGLTAQEVNLHLQGDGAFDQTFVTYPSVQAGGLGPNFNQNSCVNCHIRNGRGSSPQFSGDLSSGLLLRISLAGLGTYNDAISVPGFGTQLQTKAIFGVTPEGKITIAYSPITETLADGTVVTLQKPIYSITDTYISLPNGTQISPRSPPPVFGLGLIDALSTSSILAQADENDSNGDGISGRANYVWDYETNQIKLGRFGLKASSYSLFHQTASAYHQDMGITNMLFTSESCATQTNCVSGLNPNNDIDQNTLDITTFYTKSLGVPARRNTKDASVIAGKALFASLDCIKCHTPKQVTGTSTVGTLTNQTFFPYSDFLLHDMGNELADNRNDFLATGTEWKTTPLWGIGLAKVVNSKAQFMHDGRAKTIQEAILWHGGEAQTSKNKFKQLSAKDRTDLLNFINSL